MEESLCNIEILQNNSTFIARMTSDLGGMREYKSSSFEGLLDQIINELQDEFDHAL